MYKKLYFLLPAGLLLFSAAACVSPSLPLPQAYRNKKFLILQGFPCFFYASLI